MADFEVTPAATPAETQAEPATVWICINDQTEYPPGPGHVCPQCGSPDHTGKTVPPEPAEPEPAEIEAKPRATRKRKTEAT